MFCDTAATNTPMTRAFEAEGWTRLADHRAAMPRRFVPEANCSS